MHKLSNGKVQVAFELDEETYWELVKMGAEIRTPLDEYISNLLVSHVSYNLENVIS
jgi:hypothetical protein